MFTYLILWLRYLDLGVCCRLDFFAFSFLFGRDRISIKDCASHAEDVIYKHDLFLCQHCFTLQSSYFLPLVCHAGKIVRLSGLVHSILRAVKGSFMQKYHTQRTFYIDRRRALLYLIPRLCYLVHGVHDRLAKETYYYITSVQVFIIYPGGEDHRQTLHTRSLPQ